MTELDAVPPALVRLWRLRPETKVGRPAKLTVDRVVVAAVDLADRGGLAELSVGVVANALGVAKMALYRYIGSKEELLELMADHAFGTPPPPPPRAGWLARLRHLAVAERALYRRHPWLADVPIAGPPRGPNAIAWMDAMLGALRTTGLGPATRIHVLNVLSGYVRQTSSQLREIDEHSRAAGREQQDTEREYGRAMAVLVDPRRYPHAAELFDARLWEPSPDDSPDDMPADHDPDFDPGLDLILDGVAAAVRAARRAER